MNNPATTSQALQIALLSRDRAESMIKSICTLANLIPLVSYTEADLLADGRPDRPYLGKWQHSLVALFNNQPAGILIAYERLSENRPGYALPSVYINILAVDPTLQKTGIGSHLLQNFLAREKNSGFVCLDGPKQLASAQTNSASFNEPVVRCYRKAGFEPAGSAVYDNRTDVILNYRF